jgi:hypothetical protein
MKSLALAAAILAAALCLAPAGPGEPAGRPPEYLGGRPDRRMPS